MQLDLKVKINIIKFVMLASVCVTFSFERTKMISEFILSMTLEFSVKSRKECV